MSDNILLLVTGVLVFIIVVLLLIINSFRYIGRQCEACIDYKKCWGTNNIDGFGEFPACKYFKEKRRTIEEEK